MLRKHIPPHIRDGNERRIDFFAKRPADQVRPHRSLRRVRRLIGISAASCNNAYGFTNGRPILSNKDDGRCPMVRDACLRGIDHQREIDAWKNVDYKPLAEVALGEVGSGQEPDVA